MPDVDNLGRGYPGWLAGASLAYLATHHLGLLPDGLGRAGSGTSRADWLDLLVPWLVLGASFGVLRSADASARIWTVYVVGSVLYASGHGIHLAANSIGNADPSATAHLWDEVVGHAVWYAGAALVAAALTSTMRGRNRPGAVGYLLAACVGATWATNALGADRGWVLGLAGGAMAAAYGFRGRRDLRVTLLVVGVSASTILAVATALG